jgi:hypothetical protein
MIIKKESKLYKNKYFYEIVRFPDHLELIGPLEDVRYIDKAKAKKTEFKRYHFVQVVGGKVMAAFTKRQILVTRKTP